MGRKYKLYYNGHLRGLRIIRNNNNMQIRLKCTNVTVSNEKSRFIISCIKMFKKYDARWGLDFIVYVSSSLYEDNNIYAL